jgi:hypothetical protein
MSPGTRNGGPPAGTAAPNALTYDDKHGQGTCRHQVGQDVDAAGWSTCPACGFLWHPRVVVLEGARARRRLRRAS